MKEHLVVICGYLWFLLEVCVIILIFNYRYFMLSFGLQLCHANNQIKISCNNEITYY